MSTFGIDISRYQKGMDLNRAKAEGVNFVIIKAGGGDGGLYRDSSFDIHYENAKKAGLHVGAYFFGCAKTVKQAQDEANFFIKLLQGKQFDMPVYYDVEGKMLNVNKNLLTDIVFTFCNTVEQAGFFTGIYSGEYAYNNNMNDNALTHFCHWVAKWAKVSPNLKSKMSVGMWQFGGETNYIRTNKIAGMVCDQDYCYVDYPSMIKSLGLNGYEKQEVKEEEKPSVVDATDFLRNVLMEISKMASEAIEKFK